MRQRHRSRGFPHAMARAGAYDSGKRPKLQRAPRLAQSRKEIRVQVERGPPAPGAAHRGDFPGASHGPQREISAAAHDAVGRADGKGRPQDVLVVHAVCAPRGDVVRLALLRRRQSVVRSRRAASLSASAASVGRRGPAHRRRVFKGRGGEAPRLEAEEVGRPNLGAVLAEVRTREIRRRSRLRKRLRKGRLAGSARGDDGPFARAFAREVCGASRLTARVHLRRLVDRSRQVVQTFKTASGLFAF
mmetsp:Transcript_24087/g.81180  ORF Transcript_24087/g.81180 Transcript_24087/m.81180 type:complete len:246 (+) Transcript_24087:351-1088(+)